MIYTSKCGNYIADLNNILQTVQGIRIHATTLRKEFEGLEGKKTVIYNITEYSRLSTILNSNFSKEDKKAIEEYVMRKFPEYFI